MYGIGVEAMVVLDVVLSGELFVITGGVVVLTELKLLLGGNILLGDVIFVMPPVWLSVVTEMCVVPGGTETENKINIQQCSTYENLLFKLYKQTCYCFSCS